MPKFSGAPNLEEDKTMAETAMEILQQPEVAIAGTVLGLLVAVWLIRSVFGRGYDADLEDYMGDEPHQRRR